MIKRYLSSFIITIFIYSSLVASSFFLFSESSLSKSSKNKSENIQRVSINLVEPKKIEVTKPSKKPKKIEKKIVKKQKPKPRKKVAKKIEKKIVKKEKTKPIKKNLAPQKIASKSIQKDKNIEAKKIKEQQNRYFATISETINKNKSYPRRAVLRNLQDDIKIEFTISSKGELLSFFILNGKKIFHKSAQKAIKDSFPIVPPKGVLKANTKVKLTLAYRLN